MAVATLHYKMRQTETLNFEIFELNGHQKPQFKEPTI